MYSVDGKLSTSNGTPLGDRMTPTETFPACDEDFLWKTLVKALARVRVFGITVSLPLFKASRVVLLKISMGDSENYPF